MRRLKTEGTMLHADALALSASVERGFDVYSLLAAKWKQPSTTAHRRYAVTPDYNIPMHCEINPSPGKLIADSRRDRRALHVQGHQ